MANKIRIAPSILSADFAQLGAEIAAVESAGADLIHVDVMDGHFVPNISIGPLVVRAIKPHAKRPLDVHLMIAPVDLYVKEFADAGADGISVHPEAGPHIHRTLQLIRSLGKSPGIVLNPGTPVDARLFEGTVTVSFKPNPHLQFMLDNRIDWMVGQDVFQVKETGLSNTQITTTLGVVASTAAL